MTKETHACTHCRRLIHDASVSSVDLTKSGFEVAEARNGVEGLKLLTETAPPDLALIDWNMPKMDGCELLENLRRFA